MVDACNSRGTFADMAGCSEGGAHAWGHNGIGAVMQDVYASPADPAFWLHHVSLPSSMTADQSRLTIIKGFHRPQLPHLAKSECRCPHDYH